MLISLFTLNICYLLLLSFVEIVVLATRVFDERHGFHFDSLADVYTRIFYFFFVLRTPYTHTHTQLGMPLNLIN